MAVKKTKPIVQKKKGTKPSGPKKAQAKVANVNEPARDIRYIGLFVIIAIILITIVVIAILTDNQGTISEQVPSFSAITAKTLIAATSINTAEVSGDVDLGISAMGLGINASVAIESKIDIPKNEMEMKMELSGIPGLGQTSFTTFILGDEIYSESPDLDGNTIWVRQEVPSDWNSDLMDATFLIKLITSSNGQVTGTTNYKGSEAYVVTLDPDIKTIMEYVISMGGEDFESFGLNESDIKDAVSEFAKMVEISDMTVLIDKTSSLPVSVQGDIKMNMGDGSELGLPAMGDITMSISFDLSAVWNTPVDITLPDEAKNAIDVGGII